MTEDEKELREIYFSKHPEASELDCMNWILNVYVEDEQLVQPTETKETFVSLKDYLKGIVK
jgi:hypothetical protein